MRHDVERYRMLLEAETNPRVRKILIGMIAELESRAVAIAVSPPPAVPTNQGAPVAKLERPTYYPV